MSEESQYWRRIENFFQQKFTQGEKPDLDSMIFLIGVQELGQGNRRFKKDEKVNLMHVAVCRLLEPFDYYRFSGRDQDGWPHFDKIQDLPILKPNEQTLLMRKAIIHYFKEQNYLEE
ncbi:Uncharacterised protein [Candidatus Ornithobacterium hominis]|uniref:Uncharacterized protein n=1 Tax=Candidatus Ornithobacterium hominis TaxID=2497989 RepID=A0A383TX13_9FLAO|nr:hypothetical protein [Candidatus Ornithobacterium hominis]MCT7904534.1 hypothetical protein [Candidatus Ornithobacterium hominis]CAI9430231.1 DUF2384 domain-containing protein [Candidatus Ornithobacterium hominis]SZD71431.1 Uncharacterised protein [Candidatus Ornithobacterium hominis]SZD72112.1 Uncharacterised protein [Candidatus Ornithobacterium hominis]